MTLALAPISFQDACAFVTAHHRHHKPPRGHKFSLAVLDDGKLCGVAIVGRPVSRHLQDGRTLELTRLCTDGSRNAASKLLGAARRACIALGYHKLITYTLAEEGGTSLRAAGYRCAGSTGGGPWSRAGRHRCDDHPLQPKLRWEAASSGMLQ